MRVSVGFEIDDDARRAVGWYLDGGMDAFSCLTPSEGTQFRTADQGRKAGRDEIKDFLWDHGITGLEGVVAEYDGWYGLPLREQLGDTEPTVPWGEGLTDEQRAALEAEPAPRVYDPAAE